MNSKNNRILVTGAAGFIGSALVKKLLMIGKKVVGIDNLNSYYNVDLKKDRLDQIKKCHSHPDSDWTFIEQDISDPEIRNVFDQYNFDVVINFLYTGCISLRST